jgi:hypothetical protein
MRAVILIALALAQLVVGAPARAEPAYSKYMLGEDARELRPGQRIEPRYARDRLRYLPRTDPQSRIERLFERVRQRVAAQQPSRLGSIFATDRPALWRRGLGEAQGRQLVRLEALPRAAIGVFDARHYERAYDLLVRADAASTRAEKRDLLRRAGRLAERYWTAPANGRGARPEVLLEGGAIYRGPLGR